MKKYILIITLFLFLNINFISAVPPVTTIQEFPEGYIILDAEQDYLKQNENYTHHWIVYNASNGVKISNESLNCKMYMADSKGSLLFFQIAEYNEEGFFYVNIDKNNFSITGINTYAIDCNNSNGGALAGAFEITPDGKENSLSIVIVNLIILLSLIGLLLIISYKHKNTDFSVWDQNIVKNHRNMGQTFVNGFLFTLFKNSFIWIYFIGWLFILVLNDLVYRFSSLEVYSYFKLISNIYSLGLILVIVFMIGLFASYMRKSIGLLEDDNWGLGK
jgi:hypothetical protein